MKRSNNTVIGIDVGGPRKGFRAVMLREGRICWTKTDGDPQEDYVVVPRGKLKGKDEE